jgi:hypothetical protein
VFILTLAAVLALAACGGAGAAQLTPQVTATPLPGAITGTSNGLACVAPAQPSPAGGCVTLDTATGISLRVTDAYADVTGTVIRLQTSNTAHFPLGLGDAQVALASGYELQSGLGGYYGGPGSLLVLDPLPAQDFAPHVEMVVTGHFIVPMYDGLHPPTMPPAPPWLNHLDKISLRVPFTLSPPQSSFHAYQQPPTVKQGIGVQAQSLDISPAHAAFYGAAGGARIELRFSGLPSDLELLSFIRVESERTVDGGTIGVHGPGLIELHIPGMTVDTPMMALLQSPVWPTGGNQPSSYPTVGSAGVVQFEVCFLGSGVPNGQPATLSISGIQRLTGGIDGNSGVVPTLPSYQLTLPLS